MDVAVQPCLYISAQSSVALTLALAGSLGGLEASPKLHSRQVQRASPIVVARAGLGS